MPIAPWAGSQSQFPSNPFLPVYPVHSNAKTILYERGLLF